MLKLFNKNRLKIGLAIAALLFCVFIIPRAADALAYSSANLVKGEVSRMIAATTPPATPPAVTPPADGDKTVASTLTKNVEVDETVKLLLDIMKILSIILQLLARLLWPILFLCGALMENDIIFGGAMGERLHDVWIQIRNIANLLFVLMLVGTAIYNISGFAGEKFQLKQMLPKIIMGLVLVNFSYMISTVVLDAISVGTTAMFGLPRSIGITMQDENGETKMAAPAQGALCTAISSAGKMESSTMGAVKKIADEAVKASSKAFCVKDPNDPQKLIPSPTLKEFISDWAPHSATIIMAVEFLHMQDLQNAVMGADLTFSSLTINMLFSIVMFFIYGTAFVVLFIVLLMRAIVVWLAIVLSPLMVIVYMVPEIGKKAGNLEEAVTKAIAISTAPMVIGFVLSIGYIMMTSLAGTGQIGEGVKFTTLLQDTLTWNTNISGLANFQEIMIAIGTVGFIWAGIKAATDKTVAKGATDSIMKFVSSSGAWLGKAAVMYPNIIPVPGGSHEGKESVGTLLKTMTEIPTELKNQEITKPANKLLDRIFPGRAGAAGGGAEITAATAVQKLRETRGDVEGIQRVLVTNIKEPNKELAETLAAQMEKKGLKNDANYKPLYEKAVAAGGSGKPEDVKAFADELKKFRDDSATGRELKRKFKTSEDGDDVGLDPAAETAKAEGVKIAKGLNGIKDLDETKKEAKLIETINQIKADHAEIKADEAKKKINENLPNGVTAADIRDALDKALSKTLPQAAPTAASAAAAASPTTPAPTTPTAPTTPPPATPPTGTPKP